MTVRGVLTGGNDGGGSSSTVVTTPAAGAVAGDVHLFATALPGGAQTASNEWSGFTTLSGVDNGNNTLKCYLLIKALTSGDISNGANTTTWTSSARNTAAGYTLQDVDPASAVDAVTATLAPATTRTPVAVTTGGTGGDGSVWETYLLIPWRVASGAAHPTTITCTGYTLDDLNAASSTTPSAAVASGVAVMRRNSTSGPATTVTPGTVGFDGVSVTSMVYTVTIKRVATTTGTGALTSPGATLAGDGTTYVAGAGSLTAPTPELAGTGTSRSSGAGALVAAAVVLAGSGISTTGGEGALTAPGSSLSGTAYAYGAGTGELTAPGAVLAGVGASRSSGGGSLASPGAVLAGTGEVPVAGAGALVSPSALLTGAGTSLASGSGLLVSPGSVLASTGTLRSGGAGSLASPGSALSGSAEAYSSGGGSLASPPAALAGSGSSWLTGAGLLASPGAVLVGSGEVYRPAQIAVDPALELAPNGYVLVLSPHSANLELS